MSQSDFDYDVVDPSAAERSIPVYPVAQWHNGQPAMKVAGGVQYTGGAILPAKYLSDGLRISTWTTERITFRSGKEDSALTADQVVIAPLRTRFRWLVRQGTEIVYYPRNAYVMGVHMRGHLQVQAAIQGADEPIVVTFKGKASQAFEALMKDFSAKVVQAANRLAPKEKTLPRYAFWMSIAPGPHTKVGSAGQEAFVTLPVLTLPAGMSRDYLQSIYVGRENLVRFQKWYLEAEPWVDAWEQNGVEPADTASEGEEEMTGGHEQK